jgi:hypothetical protein
VYTRAAALSSRVVSTRSLCWHTVHKEDLHPHCYAEKLRHDLANGLLMRNAGQRTIPHLACLQMQHRAGGCAHTPSQAARCPGETPPTATERQLH